MHLRGGLRWWGHARLLPSGQSEIKAAVIVRLHIQILMHRVADLELHQTRAKLSPDLEAHSLNNRLKTWMS